MSDGNKSGGNLFKKLVDIISDPEPDPPAAKHEAARVQPSPQPNYSSPPLAYSPPQPTYTPTPAPAYGTPALDDKALALVEGPVYADINGRPSRFVVFRRTLDAMKRPGAPMPDVGAVVGVMQISDPTITVQSISDDLAVHLKRVSDVRASAEAELNQAAENLVGQKQAELDQIAQANQQAVSEIERHQKEIGERQARALTVQQEKASAEQNIARAKQNALVAEDYVEGQLRQLQQSLSTAV